MPAPDRNRDAVFALEVARGLSPDKVGEGLDAGRDPFFTDGDNSVFAYLVGRYGRDPTHPIAKLIDRVIQAPPPGHAIPSKVASVRYLHACLRHGQSPAAVAACHARLVALGAPLPGLPDVARQALVLALGDGALGSMAFSTAVIPNSLALCPLPATELLALWPGHSRNWNQLKCLLQAVDQEQRLPALEQGFGGPGPWAMKLLEHLLPTTQTPAVLRFLQGWAGQEGRQWLADNAHHLLALALHHYPGRATQWLGLLAPRAHDRVWQALRADGTNPWALLLAGPTQPVAFPVPRLQRVLREANRWVDKPTMGLAGAWEAWQSLIQAMATTDQFRSPVDPVTTGMRTLGQRLLDAGATSGLQPDRVRAVVGLLPGSQALDAAVLARSMDVALSPAPPSPGLTGVRL